MHPDNICRELQEYLNKIKEGEGTAEDVEKIRKIVNQWDEYVTWGDDR